jgi:hypothetical protein
MTGLPSVTPKPRVTIAGRRVRVTPMQSLVDLVKRRDVE